MNLKLEKIGSRKRHRGWLALAAALALSLPAAGQALPNYLARHFQLPPLRLSPIAGLSRRVGKHGLELSLRQFLLLVLRNDPQIHLDRLQVSSAAAQVLSARAPFDPQLSLAFNSQRKLEPQYTQLGGASTLNSLGQSSSINFTQALPTGQNITAGFTSNRYSTNSQFNLFNPSIATGLTLSITEPLLRNRGNLLLKEPLRQAQGGVLVASDQSRVQIADLLVSAAEAYWNASGARQAIQVQQSALALAQRSYHHDQRALKLGALAPMDIYQSQAQVARTKLALLQAQAAYEESLDSLRRFIGADLNPKLRNLPITLEDAPEPQPGASPRLPLSQALAAALGRRPELLAARRQLLLDDLSETAARNRLRPELDLSGLYGSSGLGGDQIPASSLLGAGGTLQPGGLSDSLGQLFRFHAPFYGFSLQLNLPFRNSAAAASLANSYIQHSRDRAQLRDQQQSVTQSVRQADTELRMADEEIQAARVALDLTRKNVDAAHQKYLLGTTTLFEYLQQQSQLSDAETALLQAEIAWQVAAVRYRRADWTLLSSLHLHVSPLLGP